jgi:ATP-dependent exoDNAse (exonuclease V) beta subunit
MALNETVEEERRLLYVGITRARDHLIVIYANYRYMYGQMTDAVPSRFIKEFAQSRHVQALSVAQWNMTECRSYLQDWLAQKKLAFKNFISSKDDVVQFVKTVSKPQEAPSSLTFEKPTWLGAQSTSKAQPAKHAPIKATSKSKTAKAAPSIVVRSVQKSASEITVAAAKKTSGWNINQEVHHDKFGKGVIEAIDEKNIGTIHLTIRFDVGTKKIRSDFIRLPE